MERDDTSLDEIGRWSEIKLEIIRKYAEAYSTVTGAHRFHRVYIDGFAGAGEHISRASGLRVPGSPLRVLDVQPPFEEYHFVEKDRIRAGALDRLVQSHAGVSVHAGDCNEIVPGLLATVRYEEYRRAFCLLDPYGLSLNWQVIQAAGRMGTVDVLINFPIMTINRNVLCATPRQTEEAGLTALWGDQSWRDTLRQQPPQLSLFGEPDPEKLDNEGVAQAFCERVGSHGGFACVGDPLPMRNSKNAVVYYLVFASQQAVAKKIMSSIMAKYP